MANRIYDRVLALEKQTVHLYGNIVIGASGAVADTKGMGIASVVKNTTAGNYTITLQDAYNRYLFGGWGMICNGSFSGVSNVEVSDDPALVQAHFKAKHITIQCYDNTGAAVNPASGSVLTFTVEARLSSVGPN